MGRGRVQAFIPAHRRSLDGGCRRTCQTLRRAIVRRRESSYAGALCDRCHAMREDHLGTRGPSSASRTAFIGAQRLQRRRIQPIRARAPAGRRWHLPTSVPAFALRGARVAEDRWNRPHHGGVEEPAPPRDQSSTSLRPDSGILRATSKAGVGRAARTSPGPWTEDGDVQPARLDDRSLHGRTLQASMRVAHQAEDRVPAMSPSHRGRVGDGLRGLQQPGPSAAWSERALAAVDSPSSEEWSMSSSDSPSPRARSSSPP